MVQQLRNTFLYIDVLLKVPSITSIDFRPGTVEVLLLQYGLFDIGMQSKDIPVEIRHFSTAQKLWSFTELSENSKSRDQLGTVVALLSMFHLPYAFIHLIQNADLYKDILRRYT